MSIDELIGYEPQLTREQIKELYSQLKNIFANEKFVPGGNGGMQRAGEEILFLLSIPVTDGNSLLKSCISCEKKENCLLFLE